MIRILLIAVLFVAMIAAAGSAMAGKYNRVVSVGDEAPAWSELPGVDGKKHSLTDFKDAKLLVQVFFSNHCFVAEAYEDRLLEIAREYEPKGVKFVFISVSTLEDDSLDEMKTRAKEKKYPFPYVQDISQKTGRAYGATVTPQVFVTDAEGRIAYMGAVDDNWEMPDKVSRAYLRNAIDSLLEKQTPDVTETLAKGCGIEYQ